MPRVNVNPYNAVNSAQPLDVLYANKDQEGHFSLIILPENIPSATFLTKDTKYAWTVAKIKDDEPLTESSVVSQLRTLESLLADYLEQGFTCIWMSLENNPYNSRKQENDLMRDARRVIVNQVLEGEYHKVFDTRSVMNPSYLGSFFASQREETKACRTLYNGKECVYSSFDKVFPCNILEHHTIVLDSIKRVYKELGLVKCWYDDEDDVLLTLNGLMMTSHDVKFFDNTHVKDGDGEDSSSQTQEVNYVESGSETETDTEIIDDDSDDECDDREGTYSSEYEEESDDDYDESDNECDDSDDEYSDDEDASPKKKLKRD